MIFILFMDVLGYMIAKAVENELLQPLARRALQHRVSLYADNVVLFLRPDANDIAITVDILHLFGEASRLRTNLQKSNVLPIRCGDLKLQLVQELFPCATSDFSCKYLGLPFSLKKLKKEHIQHIIDKLADQLPGWKVDLLTRAGRKVHVQFVLTSMILYIAMSSDFPQWAHKAIDKIRRSYFWRGHKEAKGGHCLAVWESVCHPIEYDGLGISNLKNLDWALRAQWLWLPKTEPQHPGSALDIQVPGHVRAFFSVAISTNVGKGESTVFWTDCWLQGRKIAGLAPLLFAAIPQARRKRYTVQQAFQNHTWTADIQGVVTIEIIVEYIQMWELLLDIQLQPEVEDTHVWRLSANGKYSAKSGYDHLFMGATIFKPCERIWKSWAPPKCHFFLWLAAHKRCWTADRLACRGLPHPDKCPLCDQEDENIDHLLVSCVFSRQVWYYVLRQVDLHSLSRQPTDLVFDDWWEKAAAATSGMSKKGLNSLIILGAWAI
jgi:hypothetical protein